MPNLLVDVRILIGERSRAIISQFIDQYHYSSFNLLLAMNEAVAGEDNRNTMTNAHYRPELVRLYR